MNRSFLLLCLIISGVFHSAVSVSWAYVYDSSVEDLTTGTTSGVETRTDGTVVEYNIPIQNWPDSLTLKLQGGDGGRAKAEAAIGQDQAADGGGGAVIDIEFAVSTSAEDALKPGGKLRFIAGSRGESKTRSDVAGGGGGGGTGVLYLAPVDGSDWELLAIAGGGGGAAASSAAADTFAKEGRNANADTSGDNSSTDGGEDGAGGVSWSSYAGGGGGWLSNSNQANGGRAGQNSGGDGGSEYDFGANGGFGAGGGGAGWAELTATVSQCGGGGGGGYSGGGAGWDSDDDDALSPRGGGGGSYVVDWANSSSISTRDGDQDNGYIEVVTFTSNSDNGRIPFPTITLTGDSEINLSPGESYSDLGATATDVYGQSLTVNISIPEDLENGVVGDYTVTYSAEDQFGGGTSVNRSVNVPYFKPTFELLGDVFVLQAAGAQSVSNFAFNFDANDEGQTLDSYQISTNNDSLFSAEPSIDTEGTLTFTALNSATGTARVSVRAIDNPDDDEYGISDAVTFNITITAATKPTFELDEDVTVLQGSTIQTFSGFAFNFDSNDGDGQSLDSYLVTNDNNGLFSSQPSIDTDGVLTFTTDGSQWGSTTVSVVAIDNPDDPDNGTSDTQTFIITVTEASQPTFDLQGDVTVNEDAGAQSVSNFASNFNANDSGQSLVAYQVSDNNSSLFSVAPAIDTNGTLTFTSADDTSGSATVSVVAVDDANIGDNGLSEAQTFTITVNPVDDVPINLGLTQYEVAEGFGGTIVATVFATDPLGGGDLVFAIAGGADGSLFEIQETVSTNRESLVMYSEFDYDNPEDADGNNDYEVTISVTNAEGTATESFVIYVVEENEAPTDLALDNTQVEDGETYVGILTGTDPNENDVLTYSILGSADSSLFTVDEDTGEVSFLTAPDYDNPQDNNLDNAYRVRFQVSDGEETYDELFVINVVAFDAPPESLTINGESVTTIEIAEDIADDTQIAILMAQDPDLAGPIFFELTDDAEGRFNISNNIRLNRSSTGTIDYEVEQSIDIVLLTTDSTGAATSWTITINITDVEEPGIEEFRSTYGLSADGSDDEEDLSGNGVPNIFYYAFGLGDPNEAEIATLSYGDSTTPGLPVLVSESDGSFTYSFVKLKDDSYVSFTCESSADLSSWLDVTELSALPQPTGSSTEDIDTEYQIQHYYFDQSSDLGFFRVEVESSL